MRNPHECEYAKATAYAEVYKCKLNQYTCSHVSANRCVMEDSYGKISKEKEKEITNKLIEIRERTKNE